MNTLTSVEKAVASLPVAEQEKLLRYLTQRLQRNLPPATRLEREEWMCRLDELRSSIGTGRIEPTSEEILEELRADRSA